MDAPTAFMLHKTITLALEEDLGRGDVTTEACVDSNIHGQAQITAREPCIFCGGPVITAVYGQLDAAVQVQCPVADGTSVGAGDILIRLKGPARPLLMGERVALNFAQRLSAVATLTRRFVEALPEGVSCRIADTRKTTPGLRALERYAVRCGGGHNHREDLAAAVLIKDNHIAAAGGIAMAIARAKARAPHTARVTCEVDSLPQLQEALDAGADAVLLDNFDDEALRQGVSMAKGRALIEVSGGVTRQRVRALAEAGADIISAGALTHSAGAVDLGMDWLDTPSRRRDE